MPYLESNQDVRDNDIYNKAIGAAALIVGAAALGQGMSKEVGGFFKNWGVPKNGKGVIKELYGKELSKGFTSDMTDQITRRTVSPDGPRFDIRKSLLGHDKVKRTDGSWFERIQTNNSSDIKAFNKRMKDIHRGNFGNTPVWSQSKLSIYEDIMRNADQRGINISSKQGMNMADNTYASDINFKNRKNSGIENLVDDTEFTKSVWGDIYDNYEIKTPKEEAAKNLLGYGHGELPSGDPIEVARQTRVQQDRINRKTNAQSWKGSESQGDGVIVTPPPAYDENGNMITPKPTDRLGLPSPSIK